MDPHNLRRKAVGSIIGGVFLMLIFTSIMSSFFLIDNYRKATNELYLERQAFDNNKLIENIDYLSVTKKQDDYLNISVINSGNIGTEIVYIGEINETSLGKEDAYHRVNLFLNPYETASDITGNMISIRENDTTKLLLLTSYGNIYYYLYNDKQGGTGGPSIYYDLTITASGDGTTNPSLGVHSYSEGSNVDVYAYPDIGWSFSNWMLDSTPEGSVNPITVSMDADHSLQALFTENIIILMDDGFNDLDNWSSTNWQIQTDQWNSSPSSVKSSNGNEGNLQSNLLNTSSASELSISFWYRLSGGVDASDVDFMMYDGSGGPDLVDNLYGVEDTWVYYNYTTTDTQYFISDFYIRFNSNLQGSETVWIDDLTITLTP